MSRLTKRDSNGKVTGVYNIRCMSYDETAAILEKLAHYKDLEEQLMESAEIDIDSMVGEFMHYYNLQKENRLIELPCAVGDTVWLIGKNYNKCTNHYDCEHYDYDEYLIIWCEKNCPNGFRGTGVIQAIVETIEINRERVLVQLNAHDNYLRVPITSVFITKEEAEAKLRELERE